MRSSTILLSIGLLALFTCALCSDSAGAGSLNLDKPSEGHSTSSDTLKKESESIALDGLSVEQLKALREGAEKKEFRTEVDRIMRLITNSLYKNKEIFLRELISNASDALDKIRMLSLTDKDILRDTEELSVRIKANVQTRTLHIQDTGIGMNSKELAENLGTIAKSGTSDFLTNLLNNNNTSEASDLIGQFGVGFYSSFLVADKVTVVSKTPSDVQYIWESDSTYYTISEDPRGNTLQRGTEIILHLTPDAEDYLNSGELKRLCQKYSQFISFPIYVLTDRVETVKEESSEEEKTENADDDVSVEEDKKSEGKTVEKVVWEWEHVNKHKPLWIRKPAEVTDEEYTSLYQALTSDREPPMSKIHFSAEGDVSFKALLFIPKKSVQDVFSVDHVYKDRIKLHVHRVFIADAADDLLPKYLAFLAGVVDSDDLPLNVSREMLQQNQLVKIIKRKLIRKALEMIGKLPEEDFQVFWKEYGTLIKYGVTHDNANRVRLSKIVRFYTSKSEDKQVSLADYVSRMPEDQTAIYYLTAPSLQEAKSSPLVERLLRRNYEIIYMVEPIDEYLSQSLTEFEKKPMRNIAKGDLKLKSSDEEDLQRENEKKEYEELIDWLQKDGLNDKLEKVVLSERLARSPCAMVASEHGWSGNMERVQLSQSFGGGQDSSNEYYMKMKKTMEINPRHPLVKELKNRVSADKTDPAAYETAVLLFNIAHLRSGYSIPNPSEFSDKIEIMLRKSMGISEDEDIEDDYLEYTNIKTPANEDDSEGLDEPLDSEPRISNSEESDASSSGDAKDEL